MEEAEEEEGKEKKKTQKPKARTRREPFALESRAAGAVAPPGPQGLSRRKTPANTSPPPAPASAGKPPTVSRDPKAPSPPLDLPFWQRTWFLVLLLLMALSLFALAIFLYLGLEFDEGSPAPSFAAPPAAEGVEITYGTVLKLMHERTKFRLHSHDVPYGSGSGQQSVTGFPNVDDSNSYWIVRPVLDSSVKQGDAIESGTIIRLQHMKTRKWLHSHLHASPISGNLEVSCFGGEGESDTGDFWRLEIEGSGKTWKQDQKIRLQHVDTGGYLHSHDKKYTRIAGGQQEVCGIREKRPDNVWLATEGVYLPVNKGK
uniref:Stromal cell-derived factor 2-like protein n=1 Tax=Anthurium amnicola TaxID=1678845 RepID=A0A1D1Z0D7_9ARAE